MVSRCILETFSSLERFLIAKLGCFFFSKSIYPLVTHVEVKRVQAQFRRMNKVELTEKSLHYVGMAGKVLDGQIKRSHLKSEFALFQTSSIF